ncbi:MAG: cupredoxin domain-containing protein [Holophaga sp.]|nr:cupredoxin domain-containing protein [Holophaga sp.]
MHGINPWRAVALSLCLLPAVPAAHGEEPASIEVTIKDHRFAPADVHVKAGKPTFLIVTNLDSTPEEFEMLQLAIEKVIPPGTKARIRIRPLGPGRYPFIGEFHKDLAQGAILSE